MEGKFDAVRDEAHTLKSSAGSFGAVRLHALTKEIRDIVPVVTKVCREKLSWVQEPHGERASFEERLSMESSADTGVRKLPWTARSYREDAQRPGEIPMSERPRTTAR